MSGTVPVGTELNGCTVSVVDSGPVVDVCIDGELDLTDNKAVSRIIIDEIARAGRRTVRLQLQQLTFADSSALRTLLDALNAAEERGVQIELVDPRPQMRRLLEVTEVGSLFDIVTTAP